MRVKLSEKGLAFIKLHEGFSSTSYLCPAGYLTVGYGHVVKPSEAIQFLNPISDKEATNLLLQDIMEAEHSVSRLTKIMLSQGQFDALVSFTFNLGSGAYQRSTLRQKVNREEHHVVPEEFLKWVWAGGRRLKGLEVRRLGEVRLYQS